MRMVENKEFRTYATEQGLDISHRKDMPFYASRETRIAYFSFKSIPPAWYNRLAKWFLK